ncbi:ATP-binding protein [Gallicola sp. Sow4_E12]|uniref:sensor histidine kinase n=1 Tax=Gallicola sp. Sow4_E12 TaxID=3438785 RepID=UPI003F9072A6
MENRIKRQIKLSLQNRIIGFFTLLSIAIILVFEGVSFYSLQNYYYSTIHGILENQIRYSTYMYSSYLSDYRLEDVIIQDKDQFYRNNDGQIQILNNSGVVLFDSTASTQLGQKIETSDTLDALNGEEGNYIGKDPAVEEKVMTVARPLKSRGEQVGILRISTSLETVDELIMQRFLIYALFGIVLIGLTIFISYIMAKSIVKPINNLTKVAEKISNGQLDVHAEENDFNEIGVLGKTVNIMTNNIKEKDRIKNDFISSVSHELRTPLTSINGWASTLLYDPSDEELVREGLSIIEGECIRLSDMVEELLDFSRFTSGRVNLRKEETNITELALSIKSQLTPRAKSLGIDLVINHEEEDIFAFVDPNRIKQVLINLVDNALKFTEEEGTVMMNILSDESTVILEVIDTGIGIGQDEINKVTEKFYRGNNSNSHTGLGLSICEEIVKAHHGDMIISSKLNQGTRIKVNIPKEENGD